MDHNSMHKALNTLIRIKEKLLESMVDELLKHGDDDPSSFGLQEIEDRFAIRIANINTLIITMQDQLGQTAVSSRISTSIEEVSREELEHKLSEQLEFLAPEELAHISITPTPKGTYLIVLAHHEDPD